MSKLRPKNGNLGPLEVLLVLIFLGLAGFIGWFVYYTQQVANENYAAANTASQATPAKVTPTKAVTTTTLNKKYTDTNAYFSVSYPTDWKIKTDKDTNPDDTTVATTITSPTGTVLHLNSNNGGRGGECQPEANDKPFAKGNNCPSFEYLSSEKLPVSGMYSPVTKTVNGKSLTSLQKTNILLVTSHFMGVDNIENYSVSVKSDDHDFPVTIKEPVMGLLVKPYITAMNAKGKGYPDIYIYSEGKNAAFLNSADAQTVKAIIRSLNITLPV